MLSWVHTMQIVLLCCGVCFVMRMRNDTARRDDPKHATKLLPDLELHKLQELADVHFK